MSGKLFDDYEDEKEEGNEDYEDGPSHLLQIRQILLESKIEIDDEDCDDDNDTILILESGVRLGFDKDGKLIMVE